MSRTYRRDKRGRFATTRGFKGLTADEEDAVRRSASSAQMRSGKPFDGWAVETAVRKAARAKRRAKRKAARRSKIRALVGRRR